MVEHSRYNVGGNEGKEVFKNKLGITNQKSLDNAEGLLYKDSYDHFLKLLNSKKVIFKAQLLFEIHEYFLGTLYTWAGKVRTVEISKGDVMFCASLQIQNALKEFEKLLADNVPQESNSKKEVSCKLALIHCELNAVHPFRVGNGRTIRLFLDLLGVASGYNLIDFGKTSYNAYIAACIAGMKMDYSRMQKVIYSGLNKLT